MQFKDVIGQEAAKERLIQAAKQDRVPQALLFLGKEGTGSLPLGLAFAQYLNCENPGETDSCGVCNACKKSAKLAHPDMHFCFPVIKKKNQTDPPISDDWVKDWREAVLENPYLNSFQWLQSIDAENRQGNITARECHNIIHKLNLMAFEGKYKVQIIWMAENLGREGNILLKIIEEPPENTVFIVIAENRDRILNTILSRTQVVSLPPISDEEMTSKLISEHQMSEEDARHIALMADGNYLSAQHLAMHDADENAELFLAWFKTTINLALTNRSSLLPALSDSVNQFGGIGRENQKTFCEYGLFFTREVLAEMTGLEARLEGEAGAIAKKAAKVLNANALAKFSEVLNNLHYFIERNGNAKIQMMDASLKARKALAGQETEVVVNL